MTQGDWDVISGLAFAFFILFVLVSLIISDWDDFDGGW